MNEAIGHNSKKPRAGGVAVDQLRSIIQRLENLDEEIAGLNADKRDILSAARGEGFDVKAIRTILKMRKMDAAEREKNLRLCWMSTSLPLECRLICLMEMRRNESQVQPLRWGKPATG